MYHPTIKHGDHSRKKKIRGEKAFSDRTDGRVKPDASGEQTAMWTSTNIWGTGGKKNEKGEKKPAGKKDGEEANKVSERKKVSWVFEIRGEDFRGSKGTETARQGIKRESRQAKDGEDAFRNRQNLTKAQGGKRGQEGGQQDHEKRRES